MHEYILRTALYNVEVMFLSLLGALLAALAGALMAVQGTLNSSLGKLVGVLKATFIVHVTGTVLALALLLLPFLRETQAKGLRDVPWYLYLGGAVGVGIIYLVAISISRLGVAVATTLIIVGQVGTALLIDETGMLGLERMPFTWLKGLGLVMLAAGAGLLLKK